MANFYTDNDDLRWYIERGIDWEPLVRTTEADFRNPNGPKSVDEALAFYKETLDMVGGFVADEIAPHAAQLDREGVRSRGRRGGVSRAPRRHLRAGRSSSGSHGLCVPRELGGMNAPVMLYFLASELFGARRRRGDGAPRLPRRHGDGDAALLACARARPSSIPRTGRSSRRASRDVHRRRSCAATRGAAWTSPSPTPAATWRALRTRGEQDERRQLVRHRPEDLHHLGPRQVPLRHRAHRDGRSDPNDPLERPRRPVDVPGAGLRGGRRTARASASSPSSASRRSSATTAR